MVFPANRLEELLADAQDGRVSDSELLEGIRGASLFIPVSGGEGGAVSLPGVTLDGGQYVPAYSSEEQLVSAAGAVSRIEVAVDRLLGIMPGGVGIALNLRAEAPGLPITPDAVAALRVRE
ncbi:SseB family protein [Nocardia sp. NBC_00511]|uniref:SseB family protein n=1 Tax=Nocardia sp. NBC_00511 TaxID=2903591 RepID=UPI0030E56CE9